MQGDLPSTLVEFHPVLLGCSLRELQASVLLKLVDGGIDVPLVILWSEEGATIIAIVN